MQQSHGRLANIASGSWELVILSRRGPPLYSGRNLVGSCQWFRKGVRILLRLGSSITDSCNYSSLSAHCTCLTLRCFADNPPRNPTFVQPACRHRTKNEYSLCSMLPFLSSVQKKGMNSIIMWYVYDKFTRPRLKVSKFAAHCVFEPVMF